MKPETTWQIAIYAIGGMALGASLFALGMCSAAKAEPAQIPAKAGAEPSAIEAFYRLDGKLVSMVTEADAGRTVEIRYIPGWQLDPECPKSKWGEGQCNGGQGFLLFHGMSYEGYPTGEARLERKGCDKWFNAIIDRKRNGTLIINGKRCRAELRPVTTYQTLGR